MSRFSDMGLSDILDSEFERSGQVPTYSLADLRDILSAPLKKGETWRAVPAAAVPCAPPMTPALWKMICRNAKDTGRERCTDNGFRSDLCWLCELEKGINSIRQAMIGARENSLDRDPGRPRWSNVYAALRDYAEHALNGREPPSASGPILDNIAQGAIKVRSGGMSYRPDRADPSMTAVEDFVPITRALSEAYEDNRWGLPYGECVAVLIVRDGVDRSKGSRNVHKQPTYEEIGELCRLPPKMLRAVAARGRHCVIVELCSRGMLPMPSRDLGLHVEIDARRQAMQRTNTVSEG